MRAKLFESLLLTMLAVTVASPVTAACTTPEGARQMESAVLARDGYDGGLSVARLCLGDAQGDATPIVVQFNQQTPNAPTWAARRTNLRTALDTLEKYAGARTQSAPNREQWLIVQTQLLEELALVDNLATVDSGGGVFLDNTFWLQDNRPGTPVANNTIELLAPLNCSKPPAACPGYEPRKDLIRVFNLVRRLGDYADANKLNAHLKDAKDLDTKWKAYFNDTRPQNWWEIIINGQLMKKKHCKKDPDTDIQLGFCTVPESAWIVLHPSAAVQWVDGADDADDLEAAFVVELFGRNSWRWKGNAVSRQYGWSVITAYSNRGNDLKKWSYGLMFSRGKDMKIGVTTTSDDEIGILATTSIAGKFFEQKQKYLDYLKAKDKPANALDLLD
jgi:hypothetical protein